MRPRIYVLFSLLVLVGLTFSSCSKDTGVENPAATNVSLSSLGSNSNPSEPSVIMAAKGGKGGGTKGLGTIRVDSDNFCDKNRVDNYGMPGRTQYVWLQLALSDVQRNGGSYTSTIDTSNSDSGARTSYSGSLNFGAPCPGTNWQAAPFVVPSVEGHHTLSVFENSGRHVGKDTYVAAYPPGQ